MVHHIPVLLAVAGLPGAALACCCGWVPRPDESWSEHLKRVAAIAKITKVRDDEMVVHLRVMRCGEHLVHWCPNHDETLAAVLMGDWPEVAARLRAAER